MSEIEGRATVYRIVHRDSGRCYVGHTAAAVRYRFSQHRQKLRTGKHHSTHMQNAWRKYGEDAFDFEVIEECSEAEKLVREQFHIDGSDSAFNYAKVAGSRKGCPQPPHEVERLRQQMKGNQYTKGRKMPQEEKDRRAASGRGKTRTPEQRARMSEAMKGVKHPNARKTRPPHTEESKRKMREASAGRVFGPRSDASKAKSREAMKAYLERHKGEPWGKQRSMR